MNQNLAWVGSTGQFIFHEFPKGLGDVLSIRYAGANDGINQLYFFTLFGFIQEKLLSFDKKY